MTVIRSDINHITKDCEEMSEFTNYTPGSMAVSGGFTLLNSESLSVSSVSDNLTLSQSQDNQSNQNPSDQVSFLNIQEVFPIDEDLICTFTKNDDKIIEEDIVAICLYGDLPSNVISSVTVSDECFFQGEQKIYSVRFTAEEIPSESKLYQFCYISQNVVIGVSTPFSFGTPAESEYIAVEDPNDPGLVVFKSRVSQLNEEIAKLKDEKNDLTTKCKLNEESVALLRKELDKLDSALNHIHSQNRNLLETNKSLQKELQEYQHKSLPQMFEQMTLTPTVSDFQKISNSISEVKELLCDFKKSAVVKEDLANIEEGLESISNTLKNSSLCSCSMQNGVQNLEHSSSPIGLSSTSEPTDDLLESNESSNETLQEPELITNVSDSEKDDVQACLSKFIKENNALSNELREVKETNAFLKSRVSVLELEVCSMNEKKYQLLMDCICAYEHDNSCLKSEIEKFKKDECEIQSLKRQLALLTHENEILRSHVRSPTVLPNTQEDRCLPEVQNELSIALNEIQVLKKKLMDLRKQTVGKISLLQSPNSKSNEDTNCSSEQEGPSP